MNTQNKCDNSNQAFFDSTMLINGVGQAQVEEVVSSQW